MPHTNKQKFLKAQHKESTYWQEFSYAEYLRTMSEDAIKCKICKGYYWEGYKKKCDCKQPNKAMKEKKPDCKNHPTEVKHYTGELQQLANDISDLRYDKLSEFLGWLEMSLEEDAKSDYYGGRKHLASELIFATVGIKDAHIHIQRAWEVCKSHMDINNPESK